MTTRYEKSLAATLALREGCAAIFLPLFDHMLSLAAGSHKSGYFTQAGRELAHARKVAHYMVCGCGQPAITGSSFCASHNATCWRVYDNGGKTLDRYTVCLEVSRWEGHAAFYTCLGLSEGGRAFSQFSEAQEGRHLGKRVKLDSLDAATRQHIVNRLSWKHEEI
jgi:hypothetical protein